jgi:hypothetical protein
MGKQILRDVTVKVNGVDFSNYVQQVGVPQTTEVQDVTGMKAKSKEKLLGIPDGQNTVTLFQDFAESKVDATLSALVGSNEPFPVVVIPNTGEVSKTNPAYASAGMVLPNYNPINGSVGAASTTDVTFENSDEDGIQRLEKKEEVEALES